MFRKLNDRSRQPISQNNRGPHAPHQPWKTSCCVSALTVGGVYYVSRVPGAVENPVIRTATRLSLSSTVIGLVCATVLFVRLDGIGRSNRAPTLKHEVRKRTALAVWKRWVVLTMPTQWIAWGLVWLIFSVLSLFFRPHLVDTFVQSFGAHVITVVVILGVFCACLLQPFAELE